MLRVSRYDKAEKALYEINKERGAGGDEWREVMIALAAVDTSMGVGTEDSGAKTLINTFVDWSKVNTSLTDVKISQEYAMQFTRAARDMMEEDKEKKMWRILSLKFNFPQQRVNKV